jgi:DNA-binding XRE family transcriptional regulator
MISPIESIHELTLLISVDKNPSFYILKLLFLHTNNLGAIMDNNRRLLGLGIGNLITALRAQTGWSQKDLGERLNYSESYISILEKKKTSISLELLIRLCKLFNLIFSDMALYLDVYSLEKRPGVIESITERLIERLKD